ncbi:MAG: biotin transporter BioY [Trueperaceae bacterium]
MTNSAPAIRDRGTLIDRLAPARGAAANVSLRPLLLVGAGVAFLALLAQLRVQIGPVPITGQTLGVLLLGAAYGARFGVLTTGAYALLGVAGLPLFAGGGSGAAYLLGPTGGYLIGFVAAAGLLGALAQRGWDRTYLSAALAMLAATLVIYLFGVTWLSFALGDLGAALAAGLVPFVPGDLIKLGAAVALLPSAWRLLGRG